MKNVLALSLVTVVALTGCVSDDESVTPAPSPNAEFKALFIPAGGVFPFPNDLFFSGSADGTVNIPVSDPTDVSDYLVSMNALDGYSTTAPVVVPFNGPIDGASITAATVRMINITNPLAPVPLTFGTAFTAAVSTAVDGSAQLMITPVAPLNPKARYMVLVTTGITSGGTPAVADATMETLLTIHGEGATPDGTVPPELAALWGATNGLFDLANAFGVTDAQIAVVASYATQSTTDTMAFVNTNATAGTAVVASTGFNTNQLNAALSGHANVYFGYISVPYYQSRTSPMTAHWHTATGGEVTRYTIAGGAGPAATETLNIPVLLTIPNANSLWGGGGTKPVAGWPLVIFQHGITGNRSNMLAIADSYADGGFAVIAIDQPLHGIASGGLRINNPNPFGVTIYERTFDLDVSNNTTGAPGADGVTDTSGQNYINLSSLLTSRDNLRQSAADLIRLVKTAPSINYDGVAGGDFDASRIHFTGHSLGGIVGTTFLGVNTDVQAATLAMPGGKIAQLLRDSATFGPRINAGLAANGVVAGTQLYEQFMQAAQTVVDSGDPINFAAAAAANHSIHMIQVVGNGGANLPDQVVPNSATARLITAMGLTRIATTTMNGGGLDGYVNFTAGDHSSILSPTASAAATVQMQTETVIYSSGYPLAAVPGCPCTANGTAIAIANPTVVQP